LKEQRWLQTKHTQLPKELIYPRFFSCQCPITPRIKIKILGVCIRSYLYAITVLFLFFFWQLLGYKKCFWYFWYLLFNFYSRKLLMCTYYMSINRWCLGDACDATQCPNITFHRIFKSFTILFLFHDVTHHDIR